MPTFIRPKVTITLSSKVLESLENAQKMLQIPSRSQAIEEAILEWIKEKKREQIEQEIADYYHSLTKREIKEDAAWAKISARSAPKVWKDG